MLPSSEILFTRTDDSAGGVLQTFKRRLKFKLRYHWMRHEIAAVFEHLSGLGLAALFDSDPMLMLRCTRTYLWTGLDAKVRAAAEIAHFDWLASVWSKPEILQFYASHAAVLAQWVIKERQVQVLLTPGRGLGREGELELHLQLDGADVMRAALSVLPHDMVGFKAPGHVLVLGNVQGSQEGKDLVKDFTQLMERTRPSNILINALQGLAQSWHLVGMLGVSDLAHPYAGYGSLSKRVGISYDALWQELGAVHQISPTHWELPMQWLPRPESEVESKKRSQLRKRNQLRQSVLDACLAQGKKKPQALKLEVESTFEGGGDKSELYAEIVAAQHFQSSGS